MSSNFLFLLCVNDLELGGFAQKKGVDTFGKFDTTKSSSNRYMITCS